MFTSKNSTILSPKQHQKSAILPPKLHLFTPKNSTKNQPFYLQNYTSLLSKTAQKISHVYLQKQYHFINKTTPKTIIMNIFSP